VVAIRVGKSSRCCQLCRARCCLVSGEVRSEEGESKRASLKTFCSLTDDVSQIHLHRSLWLTEQSGLFRPLHISPAHLATFVGRYTVTEITLILSVATSSSALPYVRRLPLLLLLRHNIDAIADHTSACALRQAALDKVSQDTFKDLLLHHLPSRYVFK
jgi:hypothetical protein